VKVFENLNPFHPARNKGEINMPEIPLQGSVGINGANMPEVVTAVKNRLVELGFDWLANTGTQVGPLTIRTIKLFQAIKNGLNTVENVHNDGLIQVGRETHKWLEASNAPHWKMMSAGSKPKGYINDEVANTGDNHDFGTDWLDDTLQAAAAKYKADFLSTHPNAAVITINDSSMPRGGDTPSHAGHEAGMACDLRLPRKDGGAGGIVVSDAAYDRVATRAMLKALKSQPLFSRMFLNDPVLIAAGLCLHLSGHDNHIHLEIKAPVRA
jgi:hypothetical protein